MADTDDWPFYEHELILGRFSLLKRLGRGSHAAVFKAFDEDDKKEVAIKMDRSDERHITECGAYHDLRGIPGIPIFVGYGYALEHPSLVMQLFDKTIDMHVLEHGPLEFTEVSRMGKLLLRTLQRCHRRRIVHRDIKPQNMVLGTDQGVLTPYMIDWGLASTFWNPIQKQHRNPGQASRVVGTDSFMSIRAQQGHRHSRRDDLESLGYALLWMGYGLLPWSRSLGLKQHSECCHYHYIQRSKYELISAPRPNIPIALHRFLSYSYSLRYQDDPDYDHLYDILDGMSQEVERYQEVS
ncbi:kinase-like domain-containing protein [Infundibulicybe gibba]|nr:kinase-like domain-containing protein [Infundibulicybe gibba]